MRRGLLGKGALLTVTSDAARTSPVTARQVVPADVPRRQPAGSAAERAGHQGEAARTPPGTSKRRRCAQTMEAHRTNPTCATCHKIFEPIGLALENFDAVGAWRTAGRGHSDRCDRRAGRRHQGRRRREPARRRSSRRSDQFVRVVTEKLLTYALGRGVEYQDMPLVRSIVRDAARQQLPVLVAGAGHREEPRVPDEYEDPPRQRRSGRPVNRKERH